jgi:hypothetical protein
VKLDGYLTVKTPPDPQFSIPRVVTSGSIPAAALVDARFDLLSWTQAMVRREFQEWLLCGIMYGEGVALAVFGIGQLIRGDGWLIRAMAREIERRAVSDLS